jgi:hypothetical protein
MAICLHATANGVGAIKRCTGLGPEFLYLLKGLVLAWGNDTKHIPMNAAMVSVAPTVIISGVDVAHDAGKLDRLRL